MEVRANDEPKSGRSTFEREKMQVAFCRTRLSDSAGMWGVIVALVTIVLVRIAIKSYRLHGGGLA